MNPQLAQIPEWAALRDAARKVREKAWAPYSKYHVGAAVLTDSGVIFTGCNVENASYGLTICAERVAICSAVAQGHRRFRAICISLTGVPVPCGACRQFLMEFSPELPVLLDNLDSPGGTAPEVVLLSELLPRAFRLDHGSL
jgi:cytidine deaminase